MNKVINYNNYSKKQITILNKKFLAAKPFPHIVLDQFLDNKFAHKILDHYKINNDWINYSFVNNFKKYGFNDRKKMNKDLNNLFNNLASKKFVSKLIKITNIQKIFLDKELDGGGLHQIFKNGHLNIHTDFTSHTKKKPGKEY